MFVMHLQGYSLSAVRLESWKLEHVVTSEASLSDRGNAGPIIAMHIANLTVEARQSSEGSTTAQN